MDEVGEVASAEEPLQVEIGVRVRSGAASATIAAARQPKTSRDT
jgi:hypothetical protein